MRCIGEPSVAAMLPLRDCNEFVMSFARVRDPAARRPCRSSSAPRASIRGSTSRNWSSASPRPGFSGISNFPTAILIDGAYRRFLESIGLGFGRELELLSPRQGARAGDARLRAHARRGGRRRATRRRHRQHRSRLEQGRRARRRHDRAHRGSRADRQHDHARGARSRAADHLHGRRRSDRQPETARGAVPGRARRRLYRRIDHRPGALGKRDRDRHRRVQGDRHAAAADRRPRATARPRDRFRAACGVIRPRSRTPARCSRDSRPPIMRSTSSASRGRAGARWRARCMR